MTKEDAQMYASLRRENRRMARINGFHLEPCLHEHRGEHGYCTDCGQGPPESVRGSSNPELTKRRVGGALKGSTFNPNG